MKKFSGALLAMVALGTTCLAASASADNLLGFYVGAGVGESTVRSDRSYSYDDYYGGQRDYYRDHHTAWKAIIGIRPIPFLGAELEYIDFGHPGGDGYYDDYYYYDSGTDSHPRAGAAFVLGYLPIPLPFLDIYGKAGVARLKTNVETFNESCAAGGGASVATCPTFYRQSQYETKIAYGAGVSSRFWGLTVRGEYERINSHYGDPDLFSVSATWTF